MLQKPLPQSKRSKNEVVVGWKTFANEVLMKNRIINGLLLLASNGEIVYKDGELNNVKNEDVLQFIGIFNDPDGDCQLFEKGIKLNINDSDKAGSQTIKYTLTRKTFHSLHATSRMNQFGIIVINLPYGILIGSHRHPVTSAVASEYFENTVEILRK